MTTLRLQSITEHDEGYAVLKGGHRIARQARQEFAAWCAICKANVLGPRWRGDEPATWFDTDIFALSALAFHVETVHPALPLE